jgi:hypothetical protein
VQENKTFLENILNILLGISWAILFFSAIIGFKLMIHNGLLIAIIGSFFGVLVGFVFISIFEIALIEVKKFHEIKKQTDILNQINDKLSNN